MTWDIPFTNAILNSISALLLVVGFVFIKFRKPDAHRNCMIAAFIVSSIFLACYLYHHFTIELTRTFPGSGIWKSIYLYVVLFPHIILAIVMLPMIFMTFFRAYKKDWIKHRSIAKWTFPIWLYVSITGVIVYVMLYQIDWTG